MHCVCTPEDEANELSEDKRPVACVSPNGPDGNPQDQLLSSTDRTIYYIIGSKRIPDEANEDLGNSATHQWLVSNAIPSAQMAFIYRTYDYQTNEIPDIGLLIVEVPPTQWLLKIAVDKISLPDLSEGLVCTPKDKH